MESRQEGNNDIFWGVKWVRACFMVCKVPSKDR
jgi:hypothetical protein